jgi:hypothetical protein
VTAMEQLSLPHAWARPVSADAIQRAFAPRDVAPEQLYLALAVNLDGLTAIRLVPRAAFAQAPPPPMRIRGFVLE